MNSPSPGPDEPPAPAPSAAGPVDLSKPVPAQPTPADQPIWAIGPDAVDPDAVDPDAVDPDAVGPDAVGPGTVGLGPLGNGEGGYAAPPPDWVPVVGAPVVRTTRRDWLIEIAAAVAVAVVLTGLGVALAYVWEAISPRTVLEMTAGGAVYTEPHPEGYVAGESVYLLMTAGLGILSPVAVWMLVRRRRGPILLAGLAVGSVAGATLMAWLGQRIGLDEYRQLLAGAPVGTRFEIPVKVYSAVIDLAGFRIQGAVLVQAMIAVAIYTFLAGFYPTPSLRPERAYVHFMPPGPLPEAQPEIQPEAQPGTKPGDMVSSGLPETSDHRAAPAPPASG